MMSNSVPREAVTIYNNALELSNRGNIPAALSEYRRALAVYPKFIEAYNNMGELHSRMGDRTGAIAVYQEALKIDRNARVLLNMGVEYFNAMDYGTALTYFRESLKKDKHFLEAHFYAGLVYHNQKDFMSAEKHLLEVLAADNRHVKANLLLSHVYYERKEYLKTIECLERIWNLAEDKSFLNKYYGFCCYYLGRYDEAISYLTVALESKPEYRKFKKYLASVSVESRMKEVGDLDRAIRELEGALLGRDAAYTEITRLSMLYIFNGQNDKAVSLVETYKNGMKRMAS